MATRTNEENGIVITGTSSADSIENSGSQVTIKGLAGNDSINNWGGMDVTIDGGTDES